MGIHDNSFRKAQRPRKAPRQHAARVLAKRQTEVDFMNGAIAEWAKVGVPTPKPGALQLTKGSRALLEDPD